MPEYITKLLHASLADRSIARTVGIRVYQSTDAGDPEPIAGDEIHGALGDETGPPEDPSEIPGIDDPNLLYCNNNPRGEPCPDCARLTGTVWRPGHQPRVPRHKLCYCFYQKT